MPYIERYKDKHLSYYAELYSCELIHNVHVDKLVFKIQNHGLSIDRLYYHLVAHKRYCCLDVLLDEQTYPSTFCVVRTYKYCYDTGKYIDERLPEDIRALVFNRMAERLILIRDIDKHATRYRPGLWFKYCISCPWKSINHHITDSELRSTLDSIYRLTYAFMATVFYKYDDIPNNLFKYSSFKTVRSHFKVYVEELDRKTVLNKTLIDGIYGVAHKNMPADVKKQVGDYMPAVLMAVIFHHYASKWAAKVSIDDIEQLITDALIVCLEN